MIPTTVKITPQNAKKRLDKFLTEQIPNISRSQIQKMIKSGDILVNGKYIKKHHWLEEGDVVQIKNINAFVDTQRIKRLQPIPNPKIKFNIIKEEKDYLIIEKPAGIIIHQSPSHQKPDTIVNGLLAQWPEIIDVKTQNSIYPQEIVDLRPGIVHRLDKNVSGLMVVARTQEMFNHLKKQFRTRRVKKIYTALVHGVIKKSDGIINFPISRSYSDRKKMAGHAFYNRAILNNRLRPRDAKTIFEVIQKFERYTLLKIQIKTGRTHQIRVHLNAYSHPVVGDKIYKPKSLKTRVDLGRLFLHACVLGFYDLNNNWQEFENLLPKDLQEFLQTLAKTPYEKS